jgi:hypothetical protein
MDDEGELRPEAAGDFIKETSYVADHLVVSMICHDCS